MHASCRPEEVVAETDALVYGRGHCNYILHERRVIEMIDGEPEPTNEEDDPVILWCTATVGDFIVTRVPVVG